MTIEKNSRRSSLYRDRNTFDATLDDGTSLRKLYLDRSYAEVRCVEDHIQLSNYSGRRFCFEHIQTVGCLHRSGCGELPVRTKLCWHSPGPLHSKTHGRRQ